MFQQTKQYYSSFLSFGGRRLALAAVLVFAAALLEGVGILVLVPILEVFSGSDSTGVMKYVDGFFSSLSITSDMMKLVLVLGAFITLLIVRNLIVWRRDVTLARLSMGFVDHWRTRVFNTLARAPWRKINAHKQTDIEHSLMSDVGRLSSGTTQSLQGVTAFVMLVVQIGIALYLSVYLTLIVLAFGVLTGVLLWPFVGRSRVLGRRQTEKGRNLFSLLDQFLSGLKLAKVHNIEEQYVSSFEDSTKSLRHQQIKFQSDRAFANLLFQIFAGLLACTVILIGLLLLNTPTAILIVFLFVQSRLTGPFQRLQAGIQSFANMLPAFESVQIMKASFETELSETADLPSKSLPELDSETPLLEFDSVSFRYSENDQTILSEVNIQVMSGEIIALSGASGSGKTTVLDLLVGLMDPDGGEIRVHGEPLSHEVLDNWRARLAYAPQDPFLFDGSLRENLTWLNQDVSDDDIWTALEQVEAKAFVSSMPAGLDSRVGERGTSISGGERQRICLARALLLKPELLILDEATNALDTDLESRLLERLIQSKSDGLTILMITHRPASLTHPHRRLSVTDGRISSELIGA